ncbi:efflux RND transporter periplasmic adaptor subunit [Mesorhizobium sp. ASY16-5R]|uniref:efflux RND transporter periplasmic adaptor subunit n=1 Tax=Mesorhizobium sp. ASY16-5R TaxID=3445772 RepID=UPI003F9F46AE
MRRLILKVIGALVLLGVIGTGGTVWLLRHNEAHPATITTPLESSPVPVEIALAASADVPIYLSGLGTVQAFNTVTIRTRVDGQLQKVLFTEGQTVKKGDLLAVIDPRPFQAALDEATAKIAQDQANLKNAQLILDRDAKLTAKQFTTVETTDTQRATVEQLQGLLAQDQAAQSDAATQLSYTQLTSPIDGRTGIRQVDEGNIVHATDTTGIVVITQLEPISAISTLSQDGLPAVRAALQAGPVPVTAFTTDGATNLGDGTLSLIDNEIDQSAGTIRLKSNFPNKDLSLWPGQSVQIRLLQRVTRGATTVPSAALQRGSEGFFVYVAGADNVVKARPVKPGQIAGGLAVVEEGLTPGERVVTAGQYRLDNGVRISPQDGGSAAVGTSAGG